MAIYRAIFPVSDTLEVVYVESPSWFGARDILRTLYHGEAFEPEWRQLTIVETVPEGEPIWIADPDSSVASAIQKPAPKKQKAIAPRGKRR